MILDELGTMPLTQTTVSDSEDEDQSLLPSTSEPSPFDLEPGLGRNAGRESDFPGTVYSIQKAKLALYCSHALSTWGQRMWVSTQVNGGLCAR